MRNAIIRVLVPVLKRHTIGPMETAEKLPCACGEGVMEVKAVTFGTWKVEEVLKPCNACNSTDIKKARQAASTNK